MSDSAAQEFAGGAAAGARPTLAVTMGDPGGVGPEVLVKALSDPGIAGSARFMILGSRSVLLRECERLGIEPFWWSVPYGPAPGGELIEAARVHDAVLVDYDALLREKGLADGDPRFPGRPNRLSGELSFRFVEDAIAAAKLPAGAPGHADGIVTAPISKEAWALAGRGKYPDHTTLLGARFNAKRYGMLFESPVLRVMLATIHIPLMDVRDQLTIGRVCDAIEMAHDASVRLGDREPRVAVCGLNPHAGEGGLLGDEEERIIAPAITYARERGIDAQGPYPADTVFNAAVRGQFDVVVAMYHDQGLIPVKLLAWETAANVTLGLPTVRTSPDHGTAFDIAGSGRADPRSMQSAVRVAVRLCSAGRGGSGER